MPKEKVAVKNFVSKLPVGSVGMQLSDAGSSPWEKVSATFTARVGDTIQHGDLTVTIADLKDQNWAIMVRDGEKVDYCWLGGTYNIELEMGEDIEVAYFKAVRDVQNPQTGKIVAQKDESQIRIVL